MAELTEAERAAEQLVSQQREAGRPAGRAWAEAQTSKPTHREICEAADAEYPGHGDDFILAYNLSEGFIDEATRVIKEKFDG